MEIVLTLESAIDNTEAVVCPPPPTTAVTTTSQHCRQASDIGPLPGNLSVSVFASHSVCFSRPQVRIPHGTAPGELQLGHKHDQRKLRLLLDACFPTDGAIHGVTVSLMLNYLWD